MNNPLVDAAGLSLLTKKVDPVEVNGGLTRVAGEANGVLKSTVLLAAGAGLVRAKEMISEMNFDKALADAQEKSQQIMSAVGPAVQKTGEWAAENPGLAACGVACVVGLGMVAAPGLVTASVLGALGFGSGGVVGGSLAAGAQATVGNVAAGSAFAFLQSAGAGGAALATVNGVIQGTGIATAGGAVAAKAVGAGRRDPSGHAESERQEGEEECPSPPSTEGLGGPECEDKAGTPGEDKIRAKL